MSEPRSWIFEIGVRFVGGGLALLVGTALAYKLVVSRYLQGLEYYKERLRVYKEIYKHSTTTIRGIDGFDPNPDSVDVFSKEMDKFNEYVNDEDMFISDTLRKAWKNVLDAQKAVVNVETIPTPELPMEYPKQELSALHDQIHFLNEIIRDEIEAKNIYLLRDVTKWYYKAKDWFCSDNEVRRRKGNDKS